jgi:hypothetical protein
MAKIGHLALTVKKVREKFEKEKPFEMSEAHQCVSLWILDHASVQAREVSSKEEDEDEDDDTSDVRSVRKNESLKMLYKHQTARTQVQYDVSFRKSRDSAGHPLYDARDVFKPPSITTQRTKDRLIHVANSGNESVSLQKICMNARFFDLSGHGIEHFSYLKNDDLSALSSAEKLQVLSLAKNSMRSASLGSLETTGLRNLRVLDLSHNSLSKALVMCLPRLEYLSLSHNKLRGSSLQNVLGTMKGCDSLRVLDLSFNNFDWTPSEFRDNIKYLRDVGFKSLENLVLHGNNIGMSWRCQRHAVRGRDRIDQDEDGKITEIMNRIKNDFSKSQDGSHWINKTENYVMFDEPDEYAEMGTCIVKDGKRVDALYVVFERGVREYYSLNVMFQLRQKNITLIALTHTARKSLEKNQSSNTMT